MSVSEESPLPMVLPLTFAYRAQLNLTSGQTMKNSKLHFTVMPNKKRPQSGVNLCIVTNQETKNSYIGKVVGSADSRFRFMMLPAGFFLYFPIAITA